MVNDVKFNQLGTSLNKAFNDHPVLDKIGETFGSIWDGAKEGIKDLANVSIFDGTSFDKSMRTTGILSEDFRNNMH
ncbi:MAG: hypothetical protein PHC34_04440 [Candidatus Gastranaerophilales bacterium]|nr:hypothetical protein [Candidatus Gastranaerophilales bacterium]